MKMLIEQGLLAEFPYAIVEHDEGKHLCGYLGVARNHPWYGKEDDELLNVEVHGGITYSESSMFGHPSKIAYIQKHSEDSLISDFWKRALALELDRSGESRNYPIETEIDIWWLGFDCAHHRDKAWGLEGVYRDRDYVLQELEGIAKQAAEAMNSVDRG